MKKGKIIKKKDDSTYRHEARRVAAKAYGEDAIKGKYVHHKDGNVSNNDITNLQIVSTAAAHTQIHKLMPKIERDYMVLVVRTCPQALHRRIKVRAIEEDITIQKLALRIIAEYLEREG